jgi:hypothetical protein
LEVCLALNTVLRQIALTPLMTADMMMIGRAHTKSLVKLQLSVDVDWRARAQQDTEYHDSEEAGA